jgi:hypothetical protein
MPGRISKPRDSVHRATERFASFNARTEPDGRSRLVRALGGAEAGVRVAEVVTI